MNKVLMAERNPLAKIPVFLNGITRSGKLFFAKIVSGLKNMEYFQYVSALEHICYMEWMGLVRQDMAISLLQVNVDEHAYNMGIGRNLNFRFDDISGVQKELILNTPALMTKLTASIFIWHMSNSE